MLGRGRQVSAPGEKGLPRTRLLTPLDKRRDRLAGGHRRGGWKPAGWLWVAGEATGQEGQKPTSVCLSVCPSTHRKWTPPGLTVLSPLGSHPCWGPCWIWTFSVLHTKAASRLATYTSHTRTLHTHAPSLLLSLHTSLALLDTPAALWVGALVLPPSK